MPEITDPTELSLDQPGTELNLDQFEAAFGGDKTATTFSNIANLQHEMQKTVANNLRA